MFYNPYNFNSYPSNNPSPVEVPHVNGTNGAQAYQMPCNSSVLLLDDNAPIIYLVKTDSACYKTIIPYTITEYKPEPTIDSKALLERIEAIERKLNNEPDTRPAEADQPTSRTNKAAISNTSNVWQSTGSASGNASK